MFSQSWFIARFVRCHEVLMMPVSFALIVWVSFRKFIASAPGSSLASSSVSLVVILGDRGDGVVLRCVRLFRQRMATARAAGRVIAPFAAPGCNVQ